MVAAESCPLVHVTLQTSKAMSAESMSSLSSHICIKVNLDKVNILHPLDWSNLQTRADWDFLAPFTSLHPSGLHQTQNKQIKVNNYINQFMKWHSNHGVTYCTVKISFQCQCTFILKYSCIVVFQWVTYSVSLLVVVSLLMYWNITFAKCHS